MQEDASSPSKRTKDADESVSPSLPLHRMPLSPRKDLNPSVAVCMSDGRSSAPNTLPKASMLRSSRQKSSSSRTRRNLASSFASLAADSSLQPRCNSVNDVRHRTCANSAAETENILRSSTGSVDKLNTDTPSKLCKKIGTPSKVPTTPETKTKNVKSAPVSVDKPTSLSKPCRKIRTPSKVAAQVLASPTKSASKPEHSTMRLVKDSGMVLSLLLPFIFTDKSQLPYIYQPR